MGKAHATGTGKQVDEADNGQCCMAFNGLAITSVVFIL
jgi:hypothetical protein